MSRTPLLALAILLAGCSLYTEGDWFHVRSNDADMPVWVKGNVDSGVFVVSLHGGPGGSATAFGLVGFAELEEEVAVVYWDQRHAGNSLGDADADDSRVATYTEDLEAVVAVLHHRYDIDRLVLWGTSWGGTIGAHYLSAGDGAAERRAGIDGFVFEHANYSAQRSFSYSRDWVAEQSAAHLAEGEDDELWGGCVDFYEQTPELAEVADWSSHYECLSAAGGTEAPVENAHALGDVPAEFVFASPVSAALLGLNEGTAWDSEGLMQEFVLDDSLSQSMADIDVPTLVLQGRHDRVAPWEVGHDLFEAIATPDEHKQEVILEDSGHAWGGEDFVLAQRAALSFFDVSVF